MYLRTAYGECSLYGKSEGGKGSADGSRNQDALGTIRDCVQALALERARRHTPLRGSRHSDAPHTKRRGLHPGGGGYCKSSCALDLTHRPDSVLQTLDAKSRRHNRGDPGEHTYAPEAHPGAVGWRRVGTRLRIGP